MRTKDYSKANVRFGRGASRAGCEDESRIGTKDPAQKRATILNFRVTEKELAFIKAAFDKYQGGESFAEFAATSLLDGIASREMDMALIGSDSAVTIEAVEAIHVELAGRMEAFSARAEDATLQIREFMKRQEGLERVGVANAKVMRSLAESVSTLAIQVESMGSRIETVLWQ